jgi:hypothetical protein
MKDRFSSPIRFIIVFGGLFAILFTTLRMYMKWRAGELGGTDDIAMLLLTGAIAGAFWGAGMWWYGRFVKRGIERTIRPDQSRAVPPSDDK